MGRGGLDWEDWTGRTGPEDWTGRTGPEDWTERTGPEDWTGKEYCQAGHMNRT